MIGIDHLNKRDRVKWLYYNFSDKLVDAMSDSSPHKIITVANLHKYCMNHTPNYL